jgi:hypothetical protein
VVRVRGVSVGVAIVVVGVVVGVVAARRLIGGEGSSRLAVTVAGRSVDLAEGTTLAEAAARFGLHPRAGDLLDVNGRVLQAGVVAALLLVDGRAAPGGLRLRNGDRVAAVDGKDRREPLVRRVVRVPGGLPSDPQFTVSRTPGEQLIVGGALSHELVSTRFRPSGAAHAERAVALTTTAPRRSTRRASSRR